MVKVLVLAAAAFWDPSTGCYVANGRAYCPRPPVYVDQQADRAEPSDEDGMRSCGKRFGGHVCEMDGLK